MLSCGGKNLSKERFNIPLLSEFENVSSSLIIVSVRNLSMEEIMFKNIDVVYSVIAVVGMNSTSQILNVTVLQEAQDSNRVKGKRVMGGSIFLRAFNDAKFFIDSVQILHSVNREPCCPTTILFVPVFTLDLVYIYEGKVHLNGLNIHVNTENHESLESYTVIELPDKVSDYYILVEWIRLTSTLSDVQFAITFDFVFKFSYLPTLSGNGITDIRNIYLESTHRMKIAFYKTALKLNLWQPWYFIGSNVHTAESLHQVFLHHCWMGGLYIIDKLWLQIGKENGCYYMYTPLHFGSPAETINIQVSLSYSTFLGSINSEGECRTGGVLAVGVSTLLIRNCTFASNAGSGLQLINSTVVFSGDNVFYNNTAKYGGGIFIDSSSFLSITAHTKLSFIKNTAMITGGAIYVDKHELRDKLFDECFLQWDMFDLNDSSLHQDVQFVFNNNNAAVAGTAVWGGSFDSMCANFLPILNVTNDMSDPSTISSAPYGICYCNNTGLCFLSEYAQLLSTDLFPGETIEVRVAVTGQLRGLVPGLVQGRLVSDETFELPELQKTQRIRKSECTTLNYTINSAVIDLHKQLRLRLPLSCWHDTFSLGMEGNYPKPQSELKMNLHFIQCPLGFQLWSSIGFCNCLQPLLMYVSSASCDIDTQTVERTATLWMNASYSGNNTQILAVHQHCPFDYCDHNKLRVDLSSPDQQCTHNRAGVLCGGCKTGLSLTLGSPKCRHCSNNFLSLLLAFIAAGLALVAMLTCLNLTVSVGTINALILYANIVKALNPIFFPSTTFLSVFVAWLNLDIGLNSCFYDGLEFYSLTWLQFVFPVYIWLLVSVMILTSHYSTTAAKLVSRDAVKVLATLFLLSYAKLLRTILTVLSFTYISYEDTNGATHRTAVWLYDGNVEFARGKHIVLVLVAVSFGVLFIIPFTALLLFAPFLQTRSHHYTIVKWVNKLMPFLDAYQGPYTKRFRFWPGVLLLVRVVLFVSFAANGLGDPQLNLMFTVTILVGILTLLWVLGTYYEFGVLYKDVPKNLLEMFYFINIILLSTWSLLQVESNSSKTQNIVSSVFIGLAFCVFSCIVGYHTYLQLKELKLLIKILTGIKERVCPLSETGDIAEVSEEQNSTTSPSNTAKPAAVPATTFIELREPLLTEQ